MKVEFSKEFEKAVRKLSGKQLESVRNAIREVYNASDLSEITDCKKLVGYNFVYRIRIGALRAFFTFHIEVMGGIVFFRYLLSRGAAYKKDVKERLGEKDI